MKIKKFNNFVKEAISGTFDISPMGPAMPRQEITPVKGTTNPQIIWIDSNQKFYTQDDWYQLHNEYLKKGGTPLHGFTERNLSEVLNFLEKN